MAALRDSGNTGRDLREDRRHARPVTACVCCWPVLPAASALAADPPAQPRNKGEAREMFSADGLAKTSIKGIDVAYLRPGARLSEYKSVLVRPVSVSLRRDWARSSAMPSLRPRPEDVERIRARVGTYVREEFEKELTAAGIAQVQAARRRRAGDRPVDRRSVRRRTRRAESHPIRCLCAVGGRDDAGR
jgi:hypothetical protein